MLGINCLLTRPDLFNKLKQIVEYTAHDIAEKTEEATLPDVYRTLRSLGVEVDIQTIAEIYRDVLDLNNPQFSTEEQIDAILMEPIKKLVSYTREDLKTIGKNSPAVEVASRIITTIQKALNSVEATKTIQREMQDRLGKVAKSILNRTPEGRAILSKTATTDPYDAVREALILHQNNDLDGLGLMNNAEVLFNDFKKEIGDMAGVLPDDLFAKEQINLAVEILQESTYDLLLSSSEVNNALNQALKDVGFTKVVKGEVRIDWNAVKESGDIETELRKALSLKDAKGVSKFSPEQVELVLPSLMREYQNRLALRIKDEFKDTITRHGQLEKLAILASQNTGAFQNAQNNALMKGIGIPLVNQTNAKRIQKLLRLYAQILKNPLSAYSPTFANTLERTVRNEIERAVEDAGGKIDALKFARYFQLVSQFGMGVVLANPGNIPENFISGTSGMIDALISNPYQVAEVIKRGLISGVTVAKGGVRVGKERSNLNSTRANLEDRTSMQEHGLKSAKVIANLFQRITLSATDALFGQSIMTSVEIKQLRSVLKAQGLSTSESNKVLNELFFSNTAEIDALADTMIKQIKSYGLEVDEYMKTRIVNELIITNFLTSGEVFQDMVDTLMASATASDTALANKLRQVTITPDILISTRVAADATRARSMGHRPDTKLGEILERAYGASALQSKIEKAQSSGKRNWQALYEGGIGALSNTLFARKGALNWAFLSMGRSTGIPLVITLLWDLAYQGIAKGRYMTPARLKNTLDEMKKAVDDKDYSDALEKMGKDQEFTASLQQRIVRQTVGITIQGIASTLIWGIMKSRCDDNPDCVAKKFEEWVNGGYLTTFEKWLPYLMNNFIHSQFDKYRKLLPESERPKSPGDYLQRSLGIEGKQSLIDVYIDYVRKNRMGEDNIFTPIYNYAMPPIKGYGTGGFLEKYQVEDYRAAIVGNMVGNAFGLKHLRAVDIWKNRFNGYAFMMGVQPDKSPSQLKAERKQLYAEGYVEGAIKTMLTDNMFRWYTETYGHNTIEALNARPTISLGGVGEVTEKAMEKAGIKDISDLKGKGVVYISQIKKEGKGESVFSLKESIHIYNQVNNKGIGKYEARTLGLTDAEMEELTEMGYYSFDQGNITEAIQNVSYAANKARPNKKDGSATKRNLSTLAGKLRAFKNRIETE